MPKKILIVLAAIAVVLVGYVAMQPSEFRVVRTATVSAPTPDVFAQVNNFHRQGALPVHEHGPDGRPRYGKRPGATESVVEAAVRK